MYQGCWPPRWAQVADGFKKMQKEIEGTKFE